jgi:hypothetical protein
MAKAKGSSEIRLLLESLDAAYERRAWHGPNLRGSLRGVTARRAAWRPAAGLHNIWELAVHCAYWKYAVWRRLTGEKRGSFAPKGSNWFKRPLSLTEKAWRADLALLSEQQRRLRRAIAKLSPRRLRGRSRGGRWTIAQEICGITAHDVYHTGQIGLLKKLSGKKL